MRKFIINRPINIEFTGTPEAGKTTQFKIITKKLREEGFNVFDIRESAEITPPCFEKNSSDINRWIGLKTFEQLLCAKASNPDIIIIDRGFVDRIIWQEIYYSDRKISLNEVDYLYKYFINFIPMPDILFVFSIPPDLSIKRRGGEGKITTRSFVANYNLFVELFLKNYSGLFYNVNASLSIDNVSQTLMDNIHNFIAKF